MRLTAYDLAKDKSAFLGAFYIKPKATRGRNKIEPDATMKLDILRMTAKELREKYGIANCTAARLRRELGVDYKRVKITDAHLVTMRTMRDSGASAVEIGGKIGITAGAVRRLLREKKEHIKNLTESKQ